MKVYSFIGKSTFTKHRSVSEALRFAKGDSRKVFVHVEGIPNPWFVHPVVNGRIDRSIVLKPSQLDARRETFKRLAR